MFQKMRYFTQDARYSLYRLICICLAASLVSSMVAFPAYAAWETDLSTISAEEITNQLVEVVTVSFDENGDIAYGDGGKNTSSSVSIKQIAAYLNSTGNGKLELGDGSGPNADGLYTPPSGAKNSTYIIYSYGAYPRPVLKMGDYTLIEGTDYTLSYENNLNVGDAKVVATGKGWLTGSLSIDFKISGYRIIEQSPDKDSDGSYSYNWGMEVKWPTVTYGGINNSKFSVFAGPIVKSTTGDYSFLSYKPTTTSTTYYWTASDVDIYSLHPSIEKSEENPTYISCVPSSVERAFKTPADCVSFSFGEAERALLTSSIKAEYEGIEDWELLKCHINWAKRETSNTDSEGNPLWKLADFYEVKQSSTAEGFNPDSANNWVLYTGVDNTNEPISDLFPLLSFTLVPKVSGYYGLSDDEMTGMVTAELMNNADAQSGLTAYGPNTVQSDKKVVVSNNGFSDWLEDLIAKGYIEYGAFDTDPLEKPLSISVLPQKYDISNDVDGAYSGLWTRVTDTQLSYFVIPASVSSAADLPHGSEISIEGGSRIRMTDDPINLLDLVSLYPTGIDEDSRYNILKDQLCSSYMPNPLQMTVTKDDGTVVSETKINNSVTSIPISESGKYSVVVKGSYKPLINNDLWISKEITSYNLYTGSSDPLTFELVASDVDASALKNLIDGISIDEALVVIDDASDATIQAGIAAVPNGSKYIMQKDADAMESALASAKQTYWNADSTKDQIDKAAADLGAAKSAYAGAVKTQTADFSMLTAAISDAEQALEGVSASDDGSGLDVGTKWAAQADIDALSASIAAAQAVADRTASTADAPAASQAEIDAAWNDVATARNDFVSNKLHQVRGVTDENISALKAAYDAAAAHKASIDGEDATSVQKVSADEVADLADGARYVLVSAYSDLADAIDAAKPSVDDATYLTDETALALIKRLNDAVNACKVATVSVDRTALDSAISTAEAARKDVVASSDGAGVAVGTKYAAQSALDAIDTAVASAKSVAGKATASQSEVDKACADMRSATTAFQSAIKTAMPRVLSADSAAIKGVQDSYELSDAVSGFVTVTPQVTYEGSTLTGGTDYMASLRLAQATQSIDVTRGDDGSYTFRLNVAGSYTLTVTGTGNYSGSLAKTFTVNAVDPGEGDDAPGDGTGLVLSTAADANGLLRVSATYDGKAVALASATSSDTAIAEVNRQSDGTVLVSGVAPGVVIVSVQVSVDGKLIDGSLIFLSTGSGSGGADADLPSAPPVGGDASQGAVSHESGVVVGGLPSTLAGDIQLSVVTGNEVGKLSQVSSSSDGTQQARSLGMYDVKLLYQDQEVQPLGSIHVWLPVDLAEVEDGMKVVAWHWHGAATTPKVYDASHSKDADGNAYVLVSVAELSAFEAGYVRDSLPVDGNPATGDDPDSGDNNPGTDPDNNNTLSGPSSDTQPSNGNLGSGLSSGNGSLTQTGDTMLPYILVLAAIACASAGVILLVRRRRHAS